MTMRRKVSVGGDVRVESLEDRRLMSVSVLLSGTTLAIVGDGVGHTVEIWDQYTATSKQVVVSIDAGTPGASSRVLQNVATFNIVLPNGNNTVRVGLADNYIAAAKQFNISTGDGADTVSFTQVAGNDIRNSTVGLNINTADGNDNVSVSLSRLSYSTFKGYINTGQGKDALAINGSGVIGASSVDFYANLGPLSDTFVQSFDWENFNILGSPTSTWRTTVHGQRGNDTLSVIGVGGNTAATIGGLLEVNLFGDMHNDQINVDPGQFTLRGGTFRVNADGGVGDDTLSLAGNIGSGGVGGTITARLLGGDGNDLLGLSLNADNAFNHYGNNGAVLLDGGAGINHATVTGNAPATRFNA